MTDTEGLSMRVAEDGHDGLPILVPDNCTHDDHINHSENRALLRGNALDVARWLLCSEGWLHDAWALDDYVAHLAAAGVTAGLDDGLRRIVKKAARMGLCSQTHHEHLMGEARAVLALLEVRSGPEFLERPCPACGAALPPSETHFDLMAGPAGTYACPRTLPTGRDNDPQ